MLLLLVLNVRGRRERVGRIEHATARVVAMALAVFSSSSLSSLIFFIHFMVWTHKLSYSIQFCN